MNEGMNNGMNQNPLIEPTAESVFTLTDCKKYECNVCLLSSHELFLKLQCSPIAVWCL